MSPSSEIRGVRISLGVQGLPDRRRKKKDDRDDHFQRQMKDIEDEGERIHDRSVLDNKGSTTTPAKPKPRKPTPDDSTTRRIDIEA